MKLFQGKLFSSFARKVLAAALVAAAVCFFALLPAKENGGGMSAVTAEASSSASISVEKYTVEMDIAQNRRISVREEITVRFLKSGLTMFYRSLPIDQGTNISIFRRNAETTPFVVRGRQSRHGRVHRRKLRGQRGQGRFGGIRFPIP
ncbi:MAG: hypothetical protein ACLRSW_08035 [Christensenellaceae bacterium]